MITTDWQSELVTRLAALVPCGYMVGDEPASEPTALAGLALLAHGQVFPALSAARWLAKRQAHNGSVGVAANRATPGWPTAWAILLWNSVNAVAPDENLHRAIDRAVNWSLIQRGEALPRSDTFGHDSTLVGWSWAAHTHSWIEPTAMFVLALKTVGRSHHARTREAVRLLVDRLLPDGGCNYGNTTVLGQKLLPHIEPTGLTKPTGLNNQKRGHLGLEAATGLPQTCNG